MEWRDVRGNTAHAFAARVNQGRHKHVCTDTSHLQWNASYHVPHQHLSVPESISLSTIIQFQHLSLSHINLALFSELKDNCVCVRARTCVSHFCKKTSASCSLEPFLELSYWWTKYGWAAALFMTSLKRAVFLNGITALSSKSVIISNHLTWPSMCHVLGLNIPWVKHLKSLITLTSITYLSNLSSKLELGVKSKARNDGSVFWGKVMTLVNGILRLAFGRTRET